MKKLRVLIADDDADVVEALSLFLGENGHEVVKVQGGGLEAVHLYDQFKPDVVLMDVIMPGFNGITTAHAILSRDPKARIILMSGKMHADHPCVEALDATSFVSKPVQLEELGKLLEELGSETARN